MACASAREVWVTEEGLEWANQYDAFQDNAPDASSGLFHVPTPARDEMDMRMRDCLPKLRLR